MYEAKLKKLIDRFKEAKNSKGLTDEQISEIIRIFFNGEIENPEIFDTIYVAKAVGVTPAEIDKILGLGKCECCIGVHWHFEDSELITRKEFEELVEKKHYTREQYCDRGFYTNLEKFDFCPKCGKKIDWDSIRENR